MIYVVYVLSGLVIGAAGAWFAVSVRYRSAVREAEHKTNTAHGVIDELRGQVKKIDEDFQKLQASRDIESSGRVKAETQLMETNKRLKEERETHEDVETRFVDTFRALSSKALESNNNAFLRLAKENLEKLVVEARGDLEKRKEAIDGLVKPIAESLNKHEKYVKDIEKNRHEAYIKLETHLGNLLQSQHELQKETGNLVTALRKPQVRGRWGEMLLRRVIELAGMSEHFDFTEQVSVESDNGRIRPDLIVHLPAGREIVVDSKVALDAYLNAYSAESEKERKKFLSDHARQFRKHIDLLSAKKYWAQFDKAPEFVVMFIPESSFSAALEGESSLIEYGMEKKVVMATPTTLLALLSSIAYGWHQEQIARSAKEVNELGKILYERMKVLSEHLNGIGKGLGKANAAYNDAVGSMERRVFPAARQFKELKVSDIDIPNIKPVEANLNMVASTRLS